MTRVRKRRCRLCGVWLPVDGLPQQMGATASGWRCMALGVCLWRRSREFAARQTTFDFGG